MKQLFRTQIGVTPIEQTVFFNNGIVKQIDSHGIYTDKTNIDGTFAISKFEFEKLKSIFTNPVVEAIGNEVVFKEGKNKVTVKMVNHVDTTKHASIDEASAFDLPLNFYDTLTKAAWFSASNDKRVILNGVNVKGNSVRATNSYKAYKKEIVSELPEINIPVSLLSNLNGMTKYAVTKNDQDNVITFANESLTKQIILREYVGDFPNIDNFLNNTDGYKEIEVNHDELNDALALAIKLGVDTVKITNNKIESRNSNIAFEMEIQFGVDFEIFMSSTMLNQSLVKGKVMVKGAKDPIISKNETETSLVLPLRA